MNDYLNKAGDVTTRDAEAREAFEKWVTANGWEDAVGKTAYQVNGLWRAEEYAYKTVDCMWQAWLAAWNQRATASEDPCASGCKIKRAVKEFNENVTADYGVEASATQHEGTKPSS